MSNVTGNVALCNWVQLRRPMHSGLGMMMLWMIAHDRRTHDCKWISIIDTARAAGVMVWLQAQCEQALNVSNHTGSKWRDSACAPSVMLSPQAQCEQSVPKTIVELSVAANASFHSHCFNCYLIRFAASLPANLFFSWTSGSLIDVFSWSMAGWIVAFDCCFNVSMPMFNCNSLSRKKPRYQGQNLRYQGQRLAIKERFFVQLIFANLNIAQLNLTN